MGEDCSLPVLPRSLQLQLSLCAQVGSLVTPYPNEVVTSRAARVWDFIPVELGIRMYKILTGHKAVSRLAGPAAFDVTHRKQALTLV